MVRRRDSKVVCAEMKKNPKITNENKNGTNLCDDFDDCWGMGTISLLFTLGLGITILLYHYIRLLSICA